MRNKSAVLTRRQLIDDAVSLVKSKQRGGMDVDAMAEKLLAVPVTIQRWIDGDTLPSATMARRILRDLK